MRFLVMRPAAVAATGALIVPIHSDGGAPAGLPRALRATIERVAKAAGSGRLYGVTTHFGTAPERLGARAMGLGPPHRVDHPLDRCLDR